MKKIKIVIILIYVGVFLLVMLMTVFLVVKAVRETTEIYFKETLRPKIELKFTEKEIDQIVELLRKFKFLK